MGVTPSKVVPPEVGVSKRGKKCLSLRLLLKSRGLRQMRAHSAQTSAVKGVFEGIGFGTFCLHPGPENSETVRSTKERANFRGQKVPRSPTFSEFSEIG